MGSNTGVKYDGEKPRFDLVPARAELEVVKVLTYGAAKYGANNWSQLEDLESRYLAAALRHISAHRRGEKIDPESGLPHLAHAATSLMFVMENSFIEPLTK